MASRTNDFVCDASYNPPLETTYSVGAHQHDAAFGFRRLFDDLVSYLKSLG